MASNLPEPDAPCPGSVNSLFSKSHPNSSLSGTLKEEKHKGISVIFYQKLDCVRILELGHCPMVTVCFLSSAIAFEASQNPVHFLGSTESGGSHSPRRLGGGGVHWGEAT